MDSLNGLHSTSVGSIDSHSDGDDVLSISTSISSILDNQSQDNLRSKQEEFNQLIAEFDKDVRRIRSSFNYSYDKEAYFRIVAQNISHYNNSIIKLFADFPEFKNIYDKILDSCDDNSRDYMTQKLFDDYLEDLVIESSDINKLNMNCYTDYGDLEYYDIDSVRDRFNTNNKQGKSGRIRFSQDFLQGASDEVLDFIFTAHANLRGVEISNCGIEYYSLEELENIFSRLSNIKYIDLGTTYLCEFDKEQLNVIFRNLRNVKYIYLSDSISDDLDEESLRIIFGNLIKLGFYNDDLTIDYFSDGLSEESYELIESILTNNRAFNFGLSNNG